MSAKKTKGLLQVIHDTLGRKDAISLLTKNGFCSLYQVDETNYRPLYMDAIATAHSNIATGKMSVDKVMPFLPDGDVKPLSECGVDTASEAPPLPVGPYPPFRMEPPIFYGKATAVDILNSAKDHIVNRAAERDQETERSMARCVTAYNAITGHELTERDGWMFMAVLKATRACTTAKGLQDDYEDGAAYLALAGESR